MDKEFLSAYDISDMMGMSYAKALAFIKYSGIKYIKLNRIYFVSSKVFEEFTSDTKNLNFEV